MISPFSEKPTLFVYGVVLRDRERSLGDFDFPDAALLATGMIFVFALARWRAFLLASRA